MSVTIQKNAAADLSGAWLTVTALTLTDGDEVTIGFLEDEGTERIARLWIAGVYLVGPSGGQNRQGKEICAEGWIEAKLHADTTWQAVTFPTSFPTTFAALGATEGAFPFTIAASARTLVDLRLVVPASVDTAGEVHCEIAARWMNA